MFTKSARDLWQSALGTLQLEVSRHNYDTWLKNTVGVSLSDSTLTVGVPSEFVAQGLEKRMAPMVLKTLSAIAEEDLTIRYQIQEGRSASLTALPAFADRRQASHTRTTRSLPMSRGTPLNPAYTFDSFIVGKSNR